MKYQSLLDTKHGALDYYLVLAEPPSPAGLSRACPEALLSLNPHTL